MKKHVLLLAVLVALAGTSCTSDYHYAKQFLRKHRWNTRSATEQIYLCLPDTLYRTNSSSPVSSSGRTPEEYDSLCAQQTLLLSALDDSIFISQFAQSLVATLSKIRVPIVKVTSESQLPPPSRNCLILDVTALEAEEFVENTSSSFLTRSGICYHYDHPVRNFSANGWFQLNYDTSFYFLNQEISDQTRFLGTVLSLQSNRANLRVVQTPLSTNDAYHAARSLGETCAVLYIEKVLLEYISARKGKNTWYLYYNPIDNDINVMVPYKTGIEESFEIAY